MTNKPNLGALVFSRASSPRWFDSQAKAFSYSSGVNGVIVPLAEKRTLDNAIQLLLACRQLVETAATISNSMVEQQANSPTNEFEFVKLKQHAAHMTKLLEHIDSMADYHKPLRK